MRLRRPCEHDRYDEHVIWNGGAGKPVCFGGEFLPEDAVLIERIAAALLHWDADGKVHPLEDGHYAEGARFVLEALAPDQVGEPG